MGPFSLPFIMLLLFLSPLLIYTLSHPKDIALPVLTSHDHLAQLDPPSLYLRMTSDGTVQAFDESGKQVWSLSTENDDGALQPVGLEANDENLELMKAIIGETPFMTKDTVVLGSSPSTVYALHPKTGAIIHKFDMNGSTHRETDYPVDPIFIQRTEHTIKLFNHPSGAVRFEAKFAEVQLLREHDSNIDTLGKKPVSNAVIVAEPEKKLQNSRYILEGPRFTPVKTNMTYELANEFFSRISEANRTYQLPSNFLNPINQGGVPVLPLPAEDLVKASKSLVLWWIGGFVVALVVAVGAAVRFFRRKEVIPEPKHEKEQKRKKRRKPRVTEEQERQSPAKRENVNLVLTNNVIGYGSHGTRILEGSLNGRPVAVKRVLSAFYENAAKEISALIQLDDHSNILRYYTMEVNEDFVHIALERCSFNLENFILAHSPAVDKRTEVNEFERAEMQLVLEKQLELWNKDGFPTPVLMKLLRDIVRGIGYLHKKGYVHRDLKPQNVLIRRDGENLVAKLSDMGISKRLQDGSASMTSTGLGSSGWQAPEQIRNKRHNLAVDMFSFGCLLYYCITAGQHPFGQPLERDLNIDQGNVDLFLIDHIPEATDLLTKLLEQDPNKRPSAMQLKLHPFFWPSKKRYQFLLAASDRVELEDRQVTSPVLTALEAVAPTVFGDQWKDKVHIGLLEKPKSKPKEYRLYNFQRLRDLLRIIRNKANHYIELSEETKEEVGSIPDGYESYFRAKFPNLLIEVYKVLFQYCSQESPFDAIFADLEENDF